ncbi:sensor domain-containing diguanylate cyclase [Phytobacter diazotrophicus]|uniref:GGDEF domain-containing protein n=1 Tax=Phytobacter diazotrophicus TaxID=395631 RepID=UPI001C99433F|nr:sensor domain-containing diguanylate cyclase [Phytobacter diazotrophicus]MBY6259920.1 sensor domain-containing diguanylate cyclase [Phytobacter diazotrophicus]
MKKENTAIPVDDGAVALTILAKLMPCFSAQRTLKEILQAINSAVGSTLSWVVVEQDGDFQHESAGQIPCTLGDAQTFLEQSQLRRNQHAWRVICWRRQVGTILFSPTHHAADKFHGGILCKLISSAHGVEGYFFLAFPQPLFSMSIIKSVVIILVEKLKDYLAGIIAKERMTREMHRIVAQYKVLFDRAPVLMNSFDKSNRCILWNGECERLFGWSIEELNCQPDPLALFFPDDEVRHKVRASVSASPAVDMYEWHPVRRTGEVLTVLWSNILLPDKSILSIGLDITERKKAEQQLAVKATTDDLTGCFNRFSILRQFREALAACEPGDPDSHFSILMLDLDHFKNINDRWGHLTGDAALRHFCEKIRELSTPDCALGRLGGEEFLILLPQTDSQTALRFSQKIRAALVDKPLFNGDEKITLSFSAGVVFVTGGVSDTSVLLTLADDALYDAKRTGRSRTVIAEAIL